MARVQIPFINMVRFQRDESEIDYDTYYPSTDLIKMGIDYQRGIYSVPYKRDGVVGKELSFQVRVILPAVSVQATVNLNGVDILTEYMDKIIPTYWDGDTRVFQFTYTPISEGFFYFKIYISNASGILEGDRRYTSDIIRVTDELEDKKGLVKINYFDTKNRYGGLFFDRTEQDWNPTTYYTGQIVDGDPADDQEVYNNEEGEVLLESTPQIVKTLTLTEIDSSYIKVVKQQSICNNFIVNGVKYSASDFKSELIDKSNLANITMKLTQQDNDYFFNYQN